MFFCVKDCTALEKPSPDFCRDSIDCYVLDTFTLWHIANSSRPLEWLFGLWISKFLLVPVVRWHIFPATVTAIDGSGIFQFCEQRLERKSFLVLSQFLPSGTQQNRAVGDSWTKKVTGLPLIWNILKTLVLRWHYIYLFLLYSLNWFLICVHVSLHDFAHIHPLMTTWMLDCANYHQWDSRLQYKYMKIFHMIVVFRMSGCKLNKESSWFLLPFTPPRSHFFFMSITTY